MLPQYLILSSNFPPLWSTNGRRQSFNVDIVDSSCSRFTFFGMICQKFLRLFQSFHGVESGDKGGVVIHDSKGEIGSGD